MSLFDRLHDLLEALHLTEDDRLDEDAYYLEKWPDIARLSDDDIEDIARQYLSRLDYEQSDYHKVRDHLVRLRDAGK